MEIKKIPIDSNFDDHTDEEAKKLLSERGFDALWQSAGWNRMIQDAGYARSGLFFGAYDKGVLVSFAFVETRYIGLGQSADFVIGGPVGIEYIEELEQELIRDSSGRGSVFIQFEPLDGSIPLHSPVGCYKKFIEKCTAVIDLTQSEEAILGRMKQKGRYSIKVAQKYGIAVEPVALNDENTDRFYTLLTETKERDGFDVNSLPYFKIFVEYLRNEGLGTLLFAKKDGDVLAAGIFVFFGALCIYYYGASSSEKEKRKMMPTYLLQWEAIREAKAKGCQIYDFLGIACPGDANGRLAGVTDFKLKLTDQTRSWPDARIWINKRFAYLAFRLKLWLKSRMK